MKKVLVLFVLAVFLCVSFPLAALEISVGGKAGIAHSGYMGSDHRADNESSGYRNALFIRAIVGAFATFGLSEGLQIQPELLIVGSGGKANDEADPDNFFWAEGFSYLSLPVLVKGVFSLINGDLFVFGGPAAQLLLGDGSEAGSTAAGTYSVELASFNLAAMAGAGYNLAFLGGELSVELRYIQGLSRSYSFDDDHRTWSIALIGGYAYTLME